MVVASSWGMLAVVLGTYVVEASRSSYGISLLQLESRLILAESELRGVQDRSEPKEETEIFMRYMSSHDVVVCGCGKCGSTSLYEYLYQKEFGKEFDRSKACYVQDIITCGEWKGKWELVKDSDTQKEKMQSARSYALIRDPKERLISAWKSKLACGGDKYDTNTKTREWTSQYMRMLAGKASDGNHTCMTVHEFSTTLLEVHRRGMAKYLDRHFLPQSLACFGSFPPDQWTKVFEIGNEDAAQSVFDALAKDLGAASSEVPHNHSSTAFVEVSSDVAAALDEVTKAEYEMLAPYLEKRSSVFVGAHA